MLDAVIARSPQKAERAIIVLIEGANEDIEQVLASSRRKLPSLGGAQAQGSREGSGALR